MLVLQLLGRAVYAILAHPAQPTPFTDGVRHKSPPGKVGPGCDDESIEDVVARRYLLSARSLGKASLSRVDCGPFTRRLTGSTTTSTRPRGRRRGAGLLSANVLSRKKM